MPLETATYIADLNASNPADTDNESQGAAHLRLIKACLLASFPDIGDTAVTGTGANINTLLTLLNASGAIANQGLSTAIAPMGTIHTFARDPGTTLCARGGTATGTEQFILLDGSSYATSKFAALAASSFITVSGSNFSVDNLCDTGRFIRQYVPGTTTPGSTQSNQNTAHTHGTTDDGHTHTIADNGHTHTADATTTATANIGVSAGDAPVEGLVATNSSAAVNVNLNTNAPGANMQISTSVTVNANTTGVTANSATTGITVNSQGGTEGRPESYIGFICLKT